MMERRDMLVASAGGIAALLLAAQGAGSAAAETTAGAGANPKVDALAQAAGTCTVAGNVCLQHCLTILAQGDRSLGGCAKAVSQMLALCDATSTLAAFDSQYTPRLAKLCIDVCADCEKACRPHAEHHAVCKACADACVATIAQAKLIAA